MIEHKQFLQAGYPVFGLHGVDALGRCMCGDVNCTSLYKHPIQQGWSIVPVWSNDQVQALDELGHFTTGYGVRCDGLLVVDIDPRNGGDMSFLDAYECGLIVATGGGGLHGYFKIDKSLSLVEHVPSLPGIDFKSSGYVVGPGSLHASGNRYTIVKGGIDEIDFAPDTLIALLRRDEFKRAIVEGEYVEYSIDDIRDMLTYVSTDLDYDNYIRIGMALHYIGAPFEMWDEWAKGSPKYTGRGIRRRWDSFGKSTNPVTLGTLIHFASQGGWEEPVTFTPTVTFDMPSVSLDDSAVDLLRPPGFVGEVAAWIESNNRRARERVSVAAALSALGDTIGLKYTDDRDGVTSNLFMICVAGAGTGKESPQACIREILAAGGLARAAYGGIKSEQEIYRNLTLRSQACFLVIDEIGFLLKKIANATKNGGASYLDGIPGALMSIQGKAAGVMLLSGDALADLRELFQKRLAAENKKKHDNERYSQTTIDNLMSLLNDLDELGGIRAPFLSLIGFTTRANFDDSVNEETATNGFLRRTFVIIEGDNAPPMKARADRIPLPQRLADTVMQLAQCGESIERGERLQYHGRRKIIPSTRAALDMLDEIVERLDAYAADAEDGSEALYLGAYENISKISLILAAAHGLRDAEHVRWAYAYTMHDIGLKRSLVAANDTVDKAGSLPAKIIHYLRAAGEDGIREGVLLNRLRRYSRDSVLKCIDDYTKQGFIKRKALNGKIGKAGRPGWLLMLS